MKNEELFCLFTLNSTIFIFIMVLPYKSPQRFVDDDKYGDTYFPLILWGCWHHSVNNESDIRMKTHFAATLFIKGDGLDLDEVSQKLGLTPTSISRKGERYGHAQTLCDFDGWFYSPKAGDAQSLDEHIMILWNAIRPHIGYLRDLKQRFDVSISIHIKTGSLCFGKEYATNFEIDHCCVKLFAELEIPCKVFVTIIERAKAEDE